VQSQQTEQSQQEQSSWICAARPTQQSDDPEYSAVPGPFTDQVIRFTDQVIRFTDQTIRFTDQTIRFTDQVIRFTDHVIRFTD